MSILKRQRELKKAEKAAKKRARRHGLVLQPEAEPTPTVGAADLLGQESTEDEAGEGTGDADREEEDPPR